MLGVVVQRCCVRLHGALTTLLIAINSVTNNSKKHYKSRILGREVWLLILLLLVNATLIRRYGYFSK